MRNAVTIGAIVLGLAIVAAVFFSTKKNPSEQAASPAPAATAPAPQTPATSPALPATSEKTPPAPTPAATEPFAAAPAFETPSISASQTQPASAKNAAFHVKPVKSDGVWLGGEGTNSKLHVRVVPWGAGVTQVTLTDYRSHALKPDPFVVSSAVPIAFDAGGNPTDYRYPFAARSVQINGVWVELGAIGWELVASDATSATYRVVILDEDERPVLEITRRYALTKNDYELRLDQSVLNRSGKPLEIVWFQSGGSDLVNDGGYVGDSRSIVQGYADINYAGRTHVFTKGGYLAHTKLLDDLASGKRAAFWPNADLPSPNDLFWVAYVNRYFTTAVYRPLGDKANPTTADVPSLIQLFPGIGVDSYGGMKGKIDARTALMSFTSNKITLAPDERTPFDLGVYFGPRKREVFVASPYSVMSFKDSLIIYELGCTWCTFQWLAHGLLWFLRLIEGDVVSLGGVGIGLHDWGLAIIILVLVVRLLLHPITKRSQIQMAKMSKGMAALQPEIEKLKKKYKDDQASLNREMMQLYREKGVNPANVLGCLPMFLQMPIWVALYAMLFFAIELRHQPAFYGFFQLFNGWPFLADLSSPDNFIPIFDHPVEINLFLIHPNFQSINLLPILLAVVFFYQQKLTMPPPANEQARQQQAMMKYMVFIFPVMLYGAPSGLTLYIMASTAAGIVDSLIVKRHIKREEEAGTLFAKKPPKPGGFMDRVQKMIEAKMSEANEIREKGKRDRR